MDGQDDQVEGSLGEILDDPVHLSGLVPDLDAKPDEQAIAVRLPKLRDCFAHRGILERARAPSVFVVVEMIGERDPAESALERHAAVVFGIRGRIGRITRVKVLVEKGHSPVSSMRPATGSRRLDAPGRVS